MKQVEIFTDGSCLGNPGPGGYGAVMIFEQHRKELSQGFKHTTNSCFPLRFLAFRAVAVRVSLSRLGPVPPSKTTETLRSEFRLPISARWAELLLYCPVDGHDQRPRGFSTKKRSNQLFPEMLVEFR